VKAHGGKENTRRIRNHRIAFFRCSFIPAMADSEPPFRFSSETISYFAASINRSRSVTIYGMVNAKKDRSN
jgi:hypothetical protein